MGTSSSDYATARNALDRSLQIADQGGDRSLMALALANIAHVEDNYLKWDSASAHAREALALLPPDDASFPVLRARLRLGHAAGESGKPQEALVHFDALCSAQSHANRSLVAVDGFARPGAQCPLVPTGLCASRKACVM